VKNVRAAWLAWTLLVVAVVCYTLSVLLFALIPLDRLGAHPIYWPFDAINISLVSYAVVGVLILAQRPRHTVGWLFLAIGLTWEIWTLANAYVSYTELVAPNLRAPGIVLALPLKMWIVAFSLSPLLLFLFPTGHLLSPRWRSLIWLTLADTVVGLLTYGTLVEAGSFSREFPSLIEWLGINLSAQAKDMLITIPGLAVLVIFGFGVAAIVLRFQRAHGDERQQLKWFTYATIFFVAIIGIEQAFFDLLKSFDPNAAVPADLFFGIPAAFAFIALPLAVGTAILRYRLYEIDLLINRTLVYIPLTAILAGVFAASIALSQKLFIAVT
jgi:hypothetical protein